MLAGCLRSMRDMPGSKLVDQAWLTASDWVDGATVLRVAALLECGHESCGAAGPVSGMFSNVKFWREGRPQAKSPDPFKDLDGVESAAKRCYEQERTRAPLVTTLTLLVNQDGRLTTLELSPGTSARFKSCLVKEVSRLAIPTLSKMSMTLRLGPDAEKHAP